MKKIQLLLVAFLLIGATNSFAQEVIIIEEEEPSKLTFSGSVDAYFRTNFNVPNKGENFQAPATSFGNLPGFSLGMANIIATYEGEKVGAVADLVFGPRGEDAVFGSPMYAGGMAGSSQIVNQLYVYWNVSDAVTLTMGNFNTFLGYEVISPTANFNYSTSYMFSYGPFSHTGLKADFALSDNWSLMAAVMNPTDMTEFNIAGTYTLGAQLGYSTDAGGAYLNFVYGDQDGKLEDDGSLVTNQYSNGQTFQVDLTAGFDVSESIYVGVNTTYNTTSAGETFTGSSISDASGDGAGFLGFAGYLQATTSEMFSIGLRGEYFSVFNGGLEDVVGVNADGDGSVFAATLSGNVRVHKNLTLIPELRMDAMSEDFFKDNDLNDSKNLSSFMLAAVFAF
ncbi:Putative beta-barrel porin-2, OmpL-like. bbp2 [Algoriphagus locisalis]|uniref:Putative beta-barrel porin-2, OmpL-like. bbp2 n=1 Tax=Algoriphagus locisalis TaxID=305507 RepID=A0A1I7CJM2_9BACT|nr:porin [Algoriphagus locisalis]SFT99640.1 Putative beta-barrel porin-2, OmpL-like. bbp2 [Algoriphagus locisalis]